jgi:hypothetical protein
VIPFVGLSERDSSWLSLILDLELVWWWIISSFELQKHLGAMNPDSKQFLEEMHKEIR